MTATRIHEELRRQGYEGGYTILRERIGQLRPDAARKPVVRFETGPGVQAQMDWAVYDIELRSGRTPAGQSLQLRAGLLSTSVSLFYRPTGLR